MYQRRTVANGGKGGSTDPTCQLMRLSFGRKLDLILLKAVDDVSMFRDGENRPLKL